MTLESGDFKPGAEGADVKADGLAKHYDKLSLDELFHLRIRALARGDKADCDWLDRACIGKGYGAYCARIEASDTLTLCVMVELLPWLAKLLMVDAVRPLVAALEGAAQDAGWIGYLDGYAAGWKAASRRAYSRGTRYSDLLGRLAVELAGRAQTPRGGPPRRLEDARRGRRARRRGPLREHDAPRRGAVPPPAWPGADPPGHVDARDRRAPGPRRPLLHDLAGRGVAAP